MKKTCRAFSANSGRFAPRRRGAWVAVALALCAAAAPGRADELFDQGSDLLTAGDTVVSMPEMSATRGRVLFATKGCVICHSVNGVGGQAAPALDAHRMPALADPFEFSARMWIGAPDMIALQKKDLGYQIRITGTELADIFAFVHDEEEQLLFTIPGRGG